MELNRIIFLDFQLDTSDWHCNDTMVLHSHSVTKDHQKAVVGSTQYRRFIQ